MFLVLHTRCGRIGIPTVDFSGVSRGLMGQTSHMHDRRQESETSQSHLPRAGPIILRAGPAMNSGQTVKKLYYWWWGGGGGGVRYRLLYVVVVTTIINYNKLYFNSDYY